MPCTSFTYLLLLLSKLWLLISWLLIRQLLSSIGHRHRTEVDMHIRTRGITRNPVLQALQESSLSNSKETSRQIDSTGAARITQVSISKLTAKPDLEVLSPNAAHHGGKKRASSSSV